LYGSLVDAIDNLAAERVGSVLNDKWTLERLIGVGGMAAVYAGRHRNGAVAAVKVLHASLSRNKEVRERFLREGYAANKVAHAGVVKVLDDDVVASGPDEGTAYLVMELLEGESLQDRLERGEPMSEQAFLEVASEVLEVMQAAHERGVVHRDIKPENLFLAREAAGGTRVMVLDFGLARLLEGQTITAYGLALGTPSFMSPEQAAGRIDEIDGRTDLFALAATGFRIRTGRRIHDAGNPVEMVQAMSKLPAPRIRSVTPDVSAPFARVVDRALEFERGDRYESAAAMLADVKRALSELDASARKASPRVPPPVTREPTIELSEGDIVRPYGLDESIHIPKRRAVLPWIALLLIAGTGYGLWRSGVTWDVLASAVTSSSASADGGAPRDGGAAPRPPSVASGNGLRRPPPLKPRPTATPQGSGSVGQ
jgi:eukaryotic-like serine/threonine-protein kinase